MGFKIVVDSCGDLTEEMKKDDRFISVPLTLVVDGEEMQATITQRMKSP